MKVLIFRDDATNEQTLLEFPCLQRAWTPAHRQTEALLFLKFLEMNTNNINDVHKAICKSTSNVT